MSGYPFASPIGLTDAQLALLTAAAACLFSYADRATFLVRFAAALGGEPVTDFSVAAAVARIVEMHRRFAEEIVHRLRVRALNAEANGDAVLARGVRSVLNALARHDREAELRDVMKRDAREQTRRISAYGDDATA